MHLTLKCTFSLYYSSKEFQMSTMKNTGQPCRNLRVTRNTLHSPNFIALSSLKVVIGLYNANQDICEELFSEGRRSLTVLEYMLQNKAECAFKLLEEKSDEIVSPEYKKEAIAWIND